MKYNYPIFKVHVDVEGALNKMKTVLTGGFLNEGEQVTEFTNEMVKQLCHANIVPLNSCTSALTLALKLCGVVEGTEVIAPSMTCVASLTPIHNIGGKIVWADIKSNTGNIDLEEIRKKINRNTKAVLCVDWAGLPCELEELHQLCKESGIKLIQDAAHSFGATYKGKSVCHFSDFTCYSFQAIKHITCGDGGLLVCSDENDYKRAKKLKWFGFDRDGVKDEKGEWKGQRHNVDIEEAGYKFYMNNVSAALGLSQVGHIQTIIDKHKQNAKIYSEHFLTNDNITPLTFPNNSDPSYWVYTVLLNEKLDRDNILKKLNEQGIGAGLVHVPCHYYTCFKDSFEELPQTDYFYKNQLSLPCGWWLEEDDIKSIIDELEKVI